MILLDTTFISVIYTLILSSFRLLFKIVLEKLNVPIFAF